MRLKTWQECMHQNFSANGRSRRIKYQGVYFDKKNWSSNSKFKICFSKNVSTHKYSLPTQHRHKIEFFCYYKLWFLFFSNIPQYFSISEFAIIIWEATQLGSQRLLQTISSSSDQNLKKNIGDRLPENSHIGIEKENRRDWNCQNFSKVSKIVLIQCAVSVRI